MSKYQNASDLCERMTRRRYSERPYCEKILSDRQEWALNEEEIESHYMIEMKTYLKYMLNETDFTNEKYFMHTIIESKLRQKNIQ
jgi:hypothetical protein